MSDSVLYEVRDRIAHIQINRPEAMNSLNPDLMAELSARFQEADADDDNVSVVVLSGVGKHFGAGYDLKFPWSEHFGEGVLNARNMLVACAEFEFGPWDCTKPVIAMTHAVIALRAVANSQ